MVQQMSGKQEKERKFRLNYIENDIPNNECTTRRYLDSTRYCASHWYDISLKHHSGNYTNRLANHSEAATITNMLGEVTANYLHYKG